MKNVYRVTDFSLLLKKKRRKKPNHEAVCVRKSLLSAALALLYTLQKSLWLQNPVVAGNSVAPFVCTDCAAVVPCGCMVLFAAD